MSPFLLYMYSIAWVLMAAFCGGGVVLCCCGWPTRAFYSCRCLVPMVATCTWLVCVTSSERAWPLTTWLCSRESFVMLTVFLAVGSVMLCCPCGPASSPIALPCLCHVACYPWGLLCRHVLQAMPCHARSVYFWFTLGATCTILCSIRAWAFRTCFW